MVLHPNVDVSSIVRRCKVRAIPERNVQIVLVCLPPSSFPALLSTQVRHGWHLRPGPLAAPLPPPIISSLTHHHCRLPAPPRFPPEADPSLSLAAALSSPQDLMLRLPSLPHHHPLRAPGLAAQKPFLLPPAWQFENSGDSLASLGSNIGPPNPQCVSPCCG